MASGPAAAAAIAAGDGVGESCRLSELKVYTRRKRGEQNPPASASENPQPSRETLAATTTTTGDLHSSLHPPPLPLPAPPPQHHHRASSDNEASSLNRLTPVAAPDLVGFAPHQNGFVVIKDAKRPRREVREELFRKLSSQLQQVRHLLMRLEDHQQQGSIVPLIGDGGGAPSQLSVNHTTTPVATKFFHSVPVTPGPFHHHLNISVPHGVNARTSIGDSMVEKEKRTPKANQYFHNADFILGKGRFPPPSSHNKAKSSKSKKHLVDESDYRASAERKIYTSAFRSCRGLLEKLMKHKLGWVFNKPVDVEALGLYDYFSIIKHPMDLGTVKSRLANNFYDSPEEFAADVRLTFQNAMTYNPKGQDVHFMAEQLSNIFEERWLVIEAEYMVHLHRLYLVNRRKPPFSDTRTLERSGSTMHPMVVDLRPEQNQTQHVGRPTALKKPKANDINKRDMTLREKQTLSRHLQNLPLEKLDNVVQIIKKKNSALNLHDDEIEVDIDCVDTDTLWELDRFVTNYKKTLSKHKRKAELAMLARAEAERRNQERLNAVDHDPAVAEVPQQTKNVVDHQQVAAPSTVVGANNGDDVSGSSGSSHSSSDSGSSDSDSDSESASSYESDAAHSPGT